MTLTTFENVVISDNLRIWTVKTGRGFPVMLCNGGPGCCDYLEPAAKMLDDMAKVVRFEQRGCGRSDSALFELIRDAEHVIWASHEHELRALLREFVGHIC